MQTLDAILDFPNHLPERQTRPGENDNSLDLETAKRKLRPLNLLLNEPKTASLNLEHLLNLTLSEYERCLHPMSQFNAVILKHDPKYCWVNGHDPYIQSSATLAMLHSHITNIKEDDYKKDPHIGRIARQASPGKNDLTDTLNVYEGVLVMLIRNIDIF